jgi:hypothetical protein
VHRRLGYGLLLTWVLALGVGCGGGGGGEAAGGNTGGSGGNNNPPPSNPPPSSGPPQVEGPVATIRWAAASGPVAGYHVLVSRNNGSFDHEFEIDTPKPEAEIEGVPGDRVRVRVAAFDTFGNTGPFSPASDPFVFVAPPPGSGGGDPDPGPDPEPPGGGDPGPGGGGSGGGGNDPEPPVAEEPYTGPPRPGDLSGDGKADLAWQSADGTLVRVTSADLTRARVFSLPSGGWRLVAMGDFDGDALSDLLFAGSAELALARGTALREAPGELALETFASLVESGFLASGDFDGDGSHDALVVSALGASIALAAGGSIELPLLEGGANVVGSGDADGDGIDDLVFESPLGVSLWRLAAGGVASTSALPAPEGAALEGVGDFDGDGASEVAYRTAANALALQRMQEPFESTVEFALPGAALAGCADYDNDGASDRLWLAADALHVVTAGGEQSAPIDAASPWRLLRSCN